MEFKDFGDVRWLAQRAHSLDPNLTDLMEWAARVCETLGVSFVATSLWREAGGSGIHNTNPLRAFDCRCNTWPLTAVETFKAMMNREWTYDPERPALSVIVHHDAGQGEHLHFQVHPNTARRG